LKIKKEGKNEIDCLFFGEKEKPRLESITRD